MQDGRFERRNRSISRWYCKHKGWYGAGMIARQVDPLAHSTRSFFELQVAVLLSFGTLLAGPELLCFPKYQVLGSKLERQTWWAETASFAKHTHCSPCIQWGGFIAVQAGWLLQLLQFQNKSQEKCYEASLFMLVICLGPPCDMKFSSKPTWGGATLQVVKYNFLPFRIDGYT